MLQSLTEAMKLVPSLFLFSLVLGVNSQNWFQSTVDFLYQARLGVADMWRAYQDMREANYKNSDKCFHARGNYDAAWRGPGGAWIAEVIRDERDGDQMDRSRDKPLISLNSLSFNDGREFLQGGIFGRNIEDTLKDQEANRWGRSGKDPNHFRPEGLDPKY